MSHTPPHVVVICEFADSGCGLKYAGFAGGDEAKALLAAAPTMLEVLEDVIDAWRYGESITEAKEQYDAAIAIIKKARGEA